MEKIDWYRVCEKFFLWQWVVAAASLAFVIGAGVGLGKNLPMQIPLYYSLPWGKEQLANKYQLMIPMLGVWGAALLSNFLVKKIGSDKVLAALMLGATGVAELILLLAVIRIVILVT
jgi:hypothetical protein